MNENTTVKFLYPDEKKRLFQAIEADTSRYRIRKKAIFLLAEYAAMRASEIGLISISDFNISKREIYIKRLKNSRNNTLLILDDDVYNALTDYLHYREEHSINDACLFVSQKGEPISRKMLDDLMKKYCANAGIPKEKAHFHTLKHTRAVYLAELGLDTKEIQFWTGHKSIKNTELYLQFTSRQQETLFKKISYLKEKNKKEDNFMYGNDTPAADNRLQCFKNLFGIVDEGPIVSSDDYETSLEADFEDVFFKREEC